MGLAHNNCINRNRLGYANDPSWRDAEHYLFAYDATLRSRGGMLPPLFYVSLGYSPTKVVFEQLGLLSLFPQGTSPGSFAEAMIGVHGAADATDVLTGADRGNPRWGKIVTLMQSKFWSLIRYVFVLVVLFVRTVFVGLRGNPYVAGVFAAIFLGVTFRHRLSVSIARVVFGLGAALGVFAFFNPFFLGDWMGVNSWPQRYPCILLNSLLLKWSLWQLSCLAKGYEVKANRRRLSCALGREASRSSK
jgi:hypothetical protein